MQSLSTWKKLSLPELHNRDSLDWATFLLTQVTLVRREEWLSFHRKIEFYVVLQLQIALKIWCASLLFDIADASVNSPLVSLQARQSSLLWGWRGGNLINYIWGKCIYQITQVPSSWTVNIIGNHFCCFKMLNVTLLSAQLSILPEFNSSTWT